MYFDDFMIQCCMSFICQSQFDNLLGGILIHVQSQPAHCFAQACLSLGAAARKFVKKQGITRRVAEHVVLESSVEIDKECQTILGATYGHCCFGDILKLDLSSSNFCAVHGKNCQPFKGSWKSQRNLAQKN